MNEKPVLTDTTEEMILEAAGRGADPAGETAADRTKAASAERAKTAADRAKDAAAEAAAAAAAAAVTAAGAAEEAAAAAESGNRFRSNQRYFTISIYALVVVLIGSLIIRAVFMWAATIDAIRGVLAILSPFIIGSMLAFVLHPLVKWQDERLFGKLFHMKKGGLRYSLAVALTYAVIVGLVVIFFAFLVPNIIESSKELWPRLQAAYASVLEYFNTLEERYPDIDFTFLNNMLERIGDEYLSFDKIREAAMNALPVIFSTSTKVIRAIVNLFIAVVASVYLLYDSGIAARGMRRLTYALFPKKTGYHTIHTVKHCGRLFQGFVSGKAVDSLIIGVLCFILMTILRMPAQYNVLISVIVGVTNMIPYFGPYIGGGIGALILLMISPPKALIFLIMIVALQQFDGLILGPKILGDSLGLRPVMILFSVSIGGALWGVAGMFLGAPVFASVLYCIEQFVDYRLRHKHLDLDPETGRLQK